MRSSASQTETVESLSTGYHSALSRLATVLFFVISRASLPLILFLVLTANDPPITPPILFQAFIILFAGPALVAWILERIVAGTLTLGRDNLVLRRRGTTIEIPKSALAAPVPWKLPLPAPGLTLLTHAGRRFRLTLSDPGRFLGELGGAAADSEGASGRHGTLLYARAKALVSRSRWYHKLAKFGLFSLVPTLPLFNVHQYIAYGGPLGEYYLLGLASYLTTFAVYWATMAIYLMLYASIWRGLAEGIALATAWLKPNAADRVRSVVESVCTFAFYAGVPVLLGLRFLE